MEAAQQVLDHAGVATRCEAARYHRPVPSRYVWLLIQPAEAGGGTGPDNLAQVCDSCWWSCRLLLRQLVHGGLPQRPNRVHLALAKRGYQACDRAGTLADIPKEW